VRERPLGTVFAWSGASRRSLFAASIAINACSTSSLVVSSSKRHSIATRTPITGASRLPVNEDLDASL